MSRLERDLTETLLDLGIPANLKGFHYARHAIMHAITENMISLQVSKVLYPTVAREFNTTAVRVERSIRHAVEVGFERGNPDSLESIFHYSYNSCKGKPTNSEFIAILADYMKHKMGGATDEVRSDAKETETEDDSRGERISQQVNKQIS